MMALALVFTPLLLGVLALFFRKEDRRPIRRAILLSGALLHLAEVATLAVTRKSGYENFQVAVDPLGLFFLSLTSLLFLLVAVYSRGYFQHERGLVRDPVSHLFVPCMLFFLGAMSLTMVTTHLALLWVGIEGTTLATAPLIYYHHQRTALEAAWKYLLICSVGIALALLGLFVLAAAAQGVSSDLSVPALSAQARLLDPRWLRIGFILILVGFGTKMGLAPLHNWLPDAHSEAPSPVSALLSGALLNCAFLGILRVYQICVAAGLAAFAGKLLVILGIASLAVAAIFITGQKDYKRLLAYSSIEHMGILALSVGCGAGWVTLLHILNHSLAKTMLFLVSGQILLTYRTKYVSEVRGLLRTLPPAGFLLLVGGLAILGSPPFSLFLSEFLILRAGWAEGHITAMCCYLIFLGVIFVSMSRIILRMAQGDKRPLPGQSKLLRPTMLWPCYCLAAGVLVLGIYLPSGLVHYLKTAFVVLGGKV